MELVILELPNILATHVGICTLFLLSFFESAYECIAVLFLLLALPMLQVISEASLIDVTTV